MKKIIVLMLALGFCSTFWQGCLKDDCTLTRTYTLYTPIYKTLDAIKEQVKVQAPRSLHDPGQIWFYQNYIFVNERREGIHIIDNSNPNAPVNVAFLAIPGNGDLAVKENILYADCYTELLSFDVSEPTNPTLVNRLESVFPNSWYLNPDQTILVGYQKEENHTETMNCNSLNWGNAWYKNLNGGGFYFCGDLATNGFFESDGTSVNFNSGGSSGTANISVGGSFARFTFKNDRLYTVDSWTLRTFNIENKSKPTFVRENQLNWNIETIFPLNDNLIIGSTSGMLIYDVSNPDNPVYASELEHISACDPVFAQGNTAFVTLRSGTECQGYTNQLDVVNIDNIENPVLLKSFPMHNPRGLSLTNNDVLFICEGDEGLKSFDASNINNVGEKMLGQVKGFEAHDVIALPNNLALVIGKDGLYQFDVSDATNMKQISKVSIQR